MAIIGNTACWTIGCRRKEQSMVDQRTNNPNIKILAIQATNENSGFHLVFVPEALDDGQVRAALVEMGIEPLRALEVGGWKTTSQHVMAAFIPFPASRLPELLEPSRS